MRVLVTGGAGFIGPEYARELLRGTLPATAPTVLEKLTYSGNLAETATWYRENRAWWEPLKG